MLESLLHNEDVEMNANTMLMFANNGKCQKLNK